MAEKIIKAFEALRSHYLQESTLALEQVSQQEVNESTRKKDLLSVRERINYCNVIADFLPMQTVKDINEFPRLLTLAMELLLVCCDDNEADVRLLAGECINRIIKAFLNTNIGRIQVELYKEIKKNGPGRSLRAALQRFGDTCHYIRSHKCRPYVANLLPCIVKIAKRDDDTVQESLAIMMGKLCPVLGKFMTEPDVKILMKNFLPNLRSASATARRTAVSILNNLCQNSRKPMHFFSWLITMLLGTITPLTDDLPSYTILGVLLCFRNIFPNLNNLAVADDCFTGSNVSQKGKDRIIEKKQYLQVYEVTMYCTKHSDHNVVTAALENLNQVLLCRSKSLLEILLSPTGIAPTITGQLAAPPVSEIDDSGVSSDLHSLSSFSVASSTANKEDENESVLGEAGQSLSSELFSEIPTIPSVEITEVKSGSDENLPSMVSSESTLPLDEEIGLDLPRTYTDSSIVNIEGADFQRDHLDSSLSDLPDRGSQCSLEELLRNDSVLSRDVYSSIERQFNFDAVMCTGVPVLHCVRLMCSFLLQGEPGCLLPDTNTRVSVKALALNCICAAMKLFPEAMLGTMLPDDVIDDQSCPKSFQLIRDVLLFQRHQDPHLRGLTALLIASFVNSAIKESSANFQIWNESAADRYKTGTLVFEELIDILVKGLRDESSTAVKQTCQAVKNCIHTLSNSSYNLLAYNMAWNLLGLEESPYWLVKVEVMELFQDLNYTELQLLQPSWLEQCNISKLNARYADIQEQVMDSVLLELLGDEDARVRSKAAHSIVSILPNLNCLLEKDFQHLPSVALCCSTNRPFGGVIDQNLAYVIRKILNLKNSSTSKCLQFGCLQCLYLLSIEYPVAKHPYAWEMFPKHHVKPASLRSAVKPRRKVQDLAYKHNVSSCLLMSSVDFVCATWVGFDLIAHQETLKFCMNVLSGDLKIKTDKKLASANASPLGADPLAWSVFEDVDIIAATKKLFLHLAKLLSVLQHVIEQTNPVVTMSKIREKVSDSPNVVAVPTPSAGLPNTTVSPRKFTLGKSMQKRQEVHVGEKQKTSDSDVKHPTVVSVQSPEKNEQLGYFQHLPHYMKIFTLLKGAFKNYQVTAVSLLQDKFTLFVRGVLESLSMLFEFATFNELGSHTEEFLDYLKATALVDEEASFLAVQQLLKGLFGTNAASQVGMFKIADSTSQLVKYLGDPTFAYDLNVQTGTINEPIHKGLYGDCFLSNYQQMCNSLKLVPQVDGKTTDRGTRKNSMLKSFKNTFSSTNWPTENVSKERVSSIQSYIKLFEPLVIHALKSYTTASSTTLQCQAIHLLDQLIRLRVNYSLLDSDQVFIGFVLKQFELIEHGQVNLPELFVPTVFQFLVLLSYECYQRKFTQAKAIIGMPRIMRLCDGIMACGQPPQKYAIPALQPIVQDLFATQSQIRADTSKDLDTQREVVVSMLLRVISYPEVLVMLKQVLVGTKSNDEKWKRLSRQIVDALLPSLAKLEIQLLCVSDLQLLLDLLDALAPLSLRPADIILKAIFSLKVPKTCTEILRTVAMVTSLSRTLIMQNSEEIIFSRLQQLDVLSIQTLLKDELFENITLEEKHEHHVIRYLASFFISVLLLIVEELCRIYFTVTTDNIILTAMVGFAEMQITLLTFVARSGVFKKLSSMLYSLLVSGQEPSLLVVLTQKLSALKSLEAKCFLYWLFFLHSLGVADTTFWTDFLVPVRSTSSFLPWKHDFVRNGCFLLHCDFVLSEVKEHRGLSTVESLLLKYLPDILANINEHPIKELMSLILQNTSLSEVFLKQVAGYMTPDIVKEKPLMIKSLLYHLEHVDLALSSAVTQMLLALLPCVRLFGLARKLETLACRRVEYLQSLPAKSDVMPIVKLEEFLKVPIFAKRYPRLCSLVKRLTKQNPPSAQISTHPLDTTQVNLNDFMCNEKWFYSLVEKLCFSPNESKEQCKCCVFLLRSLNLPDIECIMENEKFSIHLLETCLQEFVLPDSRKRKNTSLGVLSCYETGGSTESENRQQLHNLARKIILNKINNFVLTMRATLNKESREYITYNSEKVENLSKDDRSVYNILVSCVNELSYPSCFYNQTWNVLSSDACNILELVLLFPEICMRQVIDNQVDFLSLELCFQSLGLLLHCKEFNEVLSRDVYAPLIARTIHSIHFTITQLTIRNGKKMSEVSRMNLPDETSNHEFLDSCHQISQMLDCFKSTLSPNATTLPLFILKYIPVVVNGLARIPMVNSYTRIPPIVWKFDWQPILEGPLHTEMPPLPVDILKEKDVLKEFVYRVNHIGWTSRMQFEETWAALLGVLSSPPVIDDSSIEEEIEIAQASCLAVHCITSLILDTTLAPVPGNSAISRYSVINRLRDYPFLGSKAGKKLVAIREEIDFSYCEHLSRVRITKPMLHPVVPSLLSSKLRKQQLQHGCMVIGRLFTKNLELLPDARSYGMGQISSSAIRTRLVTSDVQEDTDSDDSDSLIIKVKEKSPQTSQPDMHRKLEELDIRSCLQFLLELFEQWLSPYVVPKTPLMLKMEAIKSLCLLSDLLLEMSHYEWVLGILLEFLQNHPPEDDILLEYLIPTICKALAVLKLEGSFAERIVKEVELSLASPHIPLQISCIVGSLYILESFVQPTNAYLTPILTEYITKKFSSYLNISNTTSRRFSRVFWSLCFFLLENCSSEIQDSHFTALVLESAIKELCKTTEPSNVAPLLFQGLERLAVSFSLTHPECEKLAKLALNCIASGCTENLLPALSLLCTCMYTGKDAEQASGLSSIDVIMDAPITDSRLMVMERINVLLTRVRKGQLEEATLLATILPRILLDFLPVQEVMNKLISEFLSSQQPRPELVAEMFNKVSDLLYKEGQDAIIKEWVFLCVNSFVQRTPISMAVWSLSCFFISASTNPWLKSLFPFVVLNKGRLEDSDIEIFTIAALDFYTAQKLDSAQKQQFVQIFRNKTDGASSPYDKLLSCCEAVPSPGK